MPELTKAKPITPQSQFAESDKVSMKAWLCVAGALLGAFMAILDIQITNSSLKDIQGALSATLDEGSWISTAYLMAEIVVIPLTAWLSQVFSVKRYMFVNTCLFLLASVLCGFSWNLTSMIAFRAMQGFTGGILIPMAFTIIMTTLPRSKQSVGMAAFALCGCFAPAIGPTIGGWLTENIGWEYIFYINLVPGILLLLIIWFAMDAKPMKLNLLKNGDWIGIVSMAIGLGSLVVVLEEGNRKDWFGSDMITNLAITSVIALTIFFVVELTQKNAFINLRLFKNLSFSMVCVNGFVMGFALYGSIFLLPLYLTQIQGYNAFQIGEVIMWLAFPQLIIAPFLPKLTKLFGPKMLIMVGFLFFAISALMNAFMTHDTGADQLQISQMVRALGQPLILSPLSMLVALTLSNPKEQGSSASALYNMLRNLGGSVGIATLSTLFTRREQWHSNMLGQSVTVYQPIVRERLAQIALRMTHHGYDAYTAKQKALGALAGTVHRESAVMAFNDCFFALGIALIACAITVLFIQITPATGDAPMEAH